MLIFIETMFSLKVTKCLKCLFLDPEKVGQGQPENKPLLSGGAAADPEKPPYDPSVDTKQ